MSKELKSATKDYLKDLPTLQKIEREAGLSPGYLSKINAGAPLGTSAMKKIIAVLGKYMPPQI